MLYTTEVIDDNLDPEWKPFVLSVGKLTAGIQDARLLVECFDKDLVGSELIGTTKLNFSELFFVSKFDLVNEEKKKKKKNYTHSGILEIVSARISQKRIPPELEEVVDRLHPKDEIQLTFRGKDLLNVDTVGKSGKLKTSLILDPFFILFKEDRNGKTTQVYKSEVIDGNLNPEWKSFVISIGELLSGNITDSRLLLECYDKDLVSQELIGRCRVKEIHRHPDV